MRAKQSSSKYLSELHRTFNRYRSARFAGREDFFEERDPGGPVVFLPEHAAANVLVPPEATLEQSNRIIALIPKQERHAHFCSMRSSQALAQSVFGVIAVMGCQSLMKAVADDKGQPAFVPWPDKPEFERKISVLGEPSPTSVDVWFDVGYRTAIECKWGEDRFGTCSWPGKPESHSEYCPGDHIQRQGQTERCPLTALGVRYWDHTAELFGWNKDADYSPCPLASCYQLARNVMATCVGADGTLDVARGHALVIYDARNPAMAAGGLGDEQWRATKSALRSPALLRRLSWQSFIAQWPSDTVLNWLRSELNAKYGLTP